MACRRTPPDFDEGSPEELLELTSSLVRGPMRADPLPPRHEKPYGCGCASGSGRRSLHDDLNMRRPVGDM